MKRGIVILVCMVCLSPAVCQAQLFRRGNSFRQAFSRPTTSRFFTRSQDWTWPGELRTHLQSDPHHYTYDELNRLTYLDLLKLHNYTHDLHARRTGDWGEYFPGRSGPFYGH